MILVLGIIGVAVGLSTIAYALFSTRGTGCVCGNCHLGRNICRTDLLDYDEDGHGEREDAP